MNVFERGDANWIDVLPRITKQCKYRVHTPTKLTPTQASLEKNEGYVYQILLVKRKKVKPKFQGNNFFKTLDLKQTFSKSDTTVLSHKL